MTDETLVIISFELAVLLMAAAAIVILEAIIVSVLKEIAAPHDSHMPLEKYIRQQVPYGPLQLELKLYRRSQYSDDWHLVGTRPEGHPDLAEAKAHPETFKVEA